MDDSLTENVLVGVLRQAWRSTLGCRRGRGAGVALAQVLERGDGLAVVRCEDIHREVWATMTLMREVKGRSVVVRVLHNGSTLRSSQRSALARSEEAFARLAARGAMPGASARRPRARRLPVAPSRRSSLAFEREVPSP